MITGPQSAAARALLGWTLDDLQAKTGLTKNTLGDFENAKRPSSSETIQKITSAFEQAGIEFTPRGVQTVTPVYHIMGNDWYLNVLKEIADSNVDDVIIENVDPSKSSAAVLDAFRRLRAQGVSFRFTAEQGNTHLILPVSCYRWIPSAYFKNWVRVIYGDRVATKITGGEPGCIVIRDKDVAEAERNLFQYVWDNVKPLDIESTAHERIE